MTDEKVKRHWAELKAEVETEGMVIPLRAVLKEAAARLRAGEGLEGFDTATINLEDRACAAVQHPLLATIITTLVSVVRTNVGLGATQRFQRYARETLARMEEEAEDLSDPEKWAGYDVLAWAAVGVECRRQAEDMVAHGCSPDDLGLPAETGRTLWEECVAGVLTFEQLLREVPAARERQAQNDARENSSNNK